MYAFGTKDALTLGPLYPDRCALAQRDGFDAVIIHCFIDPGLRGARERVRIPVVGPGEVTLRAGATLNRKIGMAYLVGLYEQKRITLERALGALARTTRRGTLRPEWIRSAVRVIAEIRRKGEN